ncbi:MAG: YerC/YecD family TrpR-related protein [Bacilli bacterium]
MKKEVSKLKAEEMNELYQAILAIKNPKECKDFLDDLLTEKEKIALSGRIHCAKLFIDGRTYLEVTEETSVSSATLARVSKCVKKGKGYNKVLKRAKKAAEKASEAVDESEITE